MLQFFLAVAATAVPSLAQLSVTTNQAGVAVSAHVWSDPTSMSTSLPADCSEIVDALAAVGSVNQSLSSTGVLTPGDFFAMHATMRWDYMDSDAFNNGYTQANGFDNGYLQALADEKTNNTNCTALVVGGQAVNAPQAVNASMTVVYLDFPTAPSGFRIEVPLVAKDALLPSDTDKDVCGTVAVDWYTQVFTTGMFRSGTTTYQGGDSSYFQNVTNSTYMCVKQFLVTYNDGDSYYEDAGADGFSLENLQIELQTAVTDLLLAPGTVRAYGMTVFRMGSYSNFTRPSTGIPFSTKPSSSDDSLGGGTIFVIVLACLLAVGLVGGLLWKWKKGGDSRYEQLDNAPSQDL